MTETHRLKQLGVVPVSLSGFTSELSRTLKKMLLLIALSLKRVRVKNRERNHMVTSGKSLKKKAKQFRWESHSRRLEG